MDWRKFTVVAYTENSLTFSLIDQMAGGLLWGSYKLHYVYTV